MVESTFPAGGITRGLLAIALLSLGACQTRDGSEVADDEAAGSESDEGEAEGYTWWRDVEPIVSDRCGCHQTGNIAPFSLETHEQFVAFAGLAGAAIESGSMPPWPPDPDCNRYANSRALTPEQEEILLDYIAGDMPEGDPADAPPDEDPPSAFEPDLVLEMPEAYTPTESPDDYRCFLIPWPDDIGEDRFVTGFNVQPGERTIVHHLIVYAVPPGGSDAFTQLDDAEPGPGYTCFGGPGGPPGSARWVGGWVPGMPPFVAPEGIGQRVEPGTTLVAQIHYNIAPDNALADRSSIEFRLAESVERRAAVMPLADLAWLAGDGSMSIPAGDPDVTHQATFTQDFLIVANTMAEIGAAAGTTLEIWNAGLHLHLLGTRGRLDVETGDGSSECLIDVPDWDFHWQSGYDLVEPVRFGAEDQIRLQCWWDNGAANQPLVDGVPSEPIDRDWGDGTLDEMCLGILYVSAAGT